MLACILVGAIAPWGCGTSKSDVRAAKNSGYVTDFAAVYSAALEAVRDSYPYLIEDASAGVIKTAWHPLRINTSNNDPEPTRRGNSAMYNAYVGAARGYRGYFIRFTVGVVGGDPWRVVIQSQASEWDPTGVPSELKGDSRPHWLRGRTDALRVKIHKKLARYAVALDTEPESEPEKEASVAFSPGQFGPIPPASNPVVAAALSAARSGDFAALRVTMSEPFTWSLGAPSGVDTALAMWRADASVLAQMVAVIEGGCRSDPAKAEVTCPPAYSESAGYSGYRVGFAPGVDGIWKMTFFVSGN
ncbi:MAG: hypothetical protein AAGC55_16625 [Myxococcota bacterium]